MIQVVARGKSSEASLCKDMYSILKVWKIQSFVWVYCSLVYSYSLCRQGYRMHKFCPEHFQFSDKMLCRIKLVNIRCNAPHNLQNADNANTYYAARCLLFYWMILWKIFIPTDIWNMCAHTNISECIASQVICLLCPPGSLHSKVQSDFQRVEHQLLHLMLFTFSYCMLGAVHIVRTHQRGGGGEAGSSKASTVNSPIY